MGLSDSQIAEFMIQSAIRSVSKLEEHGRELGLPLSVEFGCHLGSVLYGVSLPVEIGLYSDGTCRQFNFPS